MLLAKDNQFYKDLFRMIFFVAMQNVITYSVNIADNIMLGSYSQNALSGAATVVPVYATISSTNYFSNNAQYTKIQ